MTKRFRMVALLLLLFQAAFSFPALAEMPPMPPSRLGGRLVGPDGAVLSTVGMEAGGWRIEVRRAEDGTPVRAAGRTTPEGWYILDIPVDGYPEQSTHADVAPGDVVEVSLYRDGSAVPVLWPAGGELVVGETGACRRVDLFVDGEDPSLGD